MEEGSFDRLARLLGGGATRRTGLRALMAAMVGLPVAMAAADAGAARKDRRSAEPRDGEDEVDAEKRPCGPKPKDNRCKKHSQCCTKYCKKSKKKGKIGRCRCVKPGRKCKTGQKCCGGATCRNGKCTKQTPPPGPACGATGATCTADASCCSGLICNSGACAPCVADVCASCQYQTIQAGIDEREGTANHTLYIAEGSYTEDLSVSGSITLVGCGAVTVKNSTAGRRVILLPTQKPAVADDYVTVELRNITVTTDTVSPNFGGGIGGEIDGAGEDGGSFGHVILSGTAKVTNGRVANKGGCVHLDSYSSLLMQDDAEISNCFADTYGGGGAYLNYSNLTMTGRSAVRDNVSNRDGGGLYIYYGVIEMSGSATIADNSSAEEGGGLMLYADSYDIPADYANGKPLFAMKDQSTITGNASYTGTGGNSGVNYGGGGVSISGACEDGTAPFTGQKCLTAYMSGSSSITGNSTGVGSTAVYGGGMNLDDVDLVISDSASITGNTATGSGGVTGSQVMLAYSPFASRALTVTKTGTATIAEQCKIGKTDDDSAVNCF
jgi:hypothetical protein